MPLGGGSSGGTSERAPRRIALGRTAPPTRAELKTLHDALVRRDERLGIRFPGFAPGHTLLQELALVCHGHQSTVNRVRFWRCWCGWLAVVCKTSVCSGLRWWWWAVVVVVEVFFFFFETNP